MFEFVAGPRARAVAAVLVGATFVAACQGGGASSRTEDRPRSIRPVVDSSWCEKRSEPVTCITSDTGELVGVLYAGAPGDQTFVMWDPGGPGLGLPDQDADLRELLPRAIRTRNVFLKTERWVLRPLPRDCLAGALGAAVPVSCDLDGLATQSGDVRRALVRVGSRTKLRLTGAYLQSFGATRSFRELVGERFLRWVVIESPGPPAGVRALTLMSARRDRVMRHVVGACSAKNVGARCGKRLVRSFWRTAREGVGPTLTGRDFLVGTIAAVSSASENRVLLGALSKGLLEGRINDGVRAQLKTLARLYEGRRPQGVLAPSMIGLWADTCPRLSGWEELAKSQDPVLAAYAWVFRGCRGVRRMQDVEPKVMTPRVEVLMLTGRDDTVAPPEVQDQWRTRGIVTSRLWGTGHFWQRPASARRVDQWIRKREAK